MANKKQAQAKEKQESKVNREELVEKASTQYGIANADQMSDAQLKAEIKAVDSQPKTNGQ